ncbi:MAG: aminopeptidase P family protein, partial [Pricia sp.]
MKSILTIRILSIVAFLLTSSFLSSQEIPTDFLSPEFHKQRREAVREMMPSNSVAVFFANAER